jgi:hypothetical protein
MTSLRWVQWRGVLDLGQSKLARLLNKEGTSLAWRHFLDEAGEGTDERIKTATNALSKFPQTERLLAPQTMRILCEKMSEIRIQGDGIAHPKKKSNLHADMKTPAAPAGSVPGYIVFGIGEVFEFCCHN